MLESVLKDTELSDPAEILLREFDGRKMPVRKLLNTLIVMDFGDIVHDVLRALERDGDIYIERMPKLSDGTIRTAICEHDIVYFNTFPTIKRSSLLYKTRVEYGDYTINHIFGCAHGCNYPCYAMQLSKRYGRITDYEDWLHPRLVRNALELLERELPRVNDEIKFVHLSFMTDPFMYDAVNHRTYPWIQNLTFKIIKKLNQEGIKATVLTKGLYPIELARNEYNKDNEYGITLVSLDTEFQKRYEPFSAPADARIAALQSLHDAKLKTWVSIEPFPTPNIVEQDLTKILERLKFVDKLIFGKWNYNPEVSSYKERNEFYQRCSDTVIDFCKKNSIQLHIKERTPGSSEYSQDIFCE